LKDELRLLFFPFLELCAGFEETGGREHFIPNLPNR
jgi:hypothetical protein